MAYSKCDIFYFVFAFIGLLSGISGFAVFLFVYGNVQAGIWAFFSGFYATVTLFIFGLKLLSVLDEWYGPPQLFRISLLGAAGAFSSFVAVICYLAVMAHYHEKIPTTKTVAKSHFIMAVWAGMTLKWSLTTALVARRLRRSLSSGYESL